MEKQNQTESTTQDKENNKEEKKKCFIIMPISDPDGYDRGHFNRVYNYLIKPACEKAGFESIRADDTSKANMIILDILEKVVKCDMAVCDLSSRNPNVFYELGFRQAFNKKTVLIKDEKTDMPFDIGSIRTLSYNESLRIDEVEKSILNLSAFIEETYNNKENDGNSLLQLISIKTEAVLPNEVTLKGDMSIVYNAIQRIEDKVDKINKSNNINNILSIKKSCTLPDGNVVKVGDNIYKQGELLGKLRYVSKNALYIEDSNRNTYPVSFNSDDFKDINTLPF